MWQRYFRMWQRYFFSMWHICSVCHLCVHPRQVLGHAGVHIGHVLTVGGTPWRHTRQDPLAVLLANKRATGVTLDAKTNKIKNKKIKNNNLRTIFLKYVLGWRSIVLYTVYLHYRQIQSRHLHKCAWKECSGKAIANCSQNWSKRLSARAAIRLLHHRRL